MALNIPHNVICIAAAKTQSTKAIQNAIKNGVKYIGENYLQEAIKKHSENAYLGAQLHFIGHLQSKKCKNAVLICDSIDSINSQKLAQKLNSEAQKIDKIQNVMIQVNIGNESQKSGINIDNLKELINHINSELNNLKLTGLMCIPPKTENPRPYFKKLKDLCKLYQLDSCSMGMSADYEIAIEEGTTHIRLGTAIFGKRET